MATADLLTPVEYTFEEQSKVSINCPNMRLWAVGVKPDFKVCILRFSEPKAMRCFVPLQTYYNIRNTNVLQPACLISYCCSNLDDAVMKVLDVI